MEEEAKIVAYVLAGCTCHPEQIDTHFARTYTRGKHPAPCPIQHNHDLGWFVVRHDPRPKRKRPPGAPRWACTCGHTGPNGMCAHTAALFIANVEEIEGFGEAQGRRVQTSPYIVKLTPVGYELFHIMWAERALRS